MMRPSLCSLSIFCGLVILASSSQAQDAATRRQQAQTLADQKNWKAALAIYESLIVDPKVPGAEAARDLEAIGSCIAEMISNGEEGVDRMDAIIAVALKAHPRDWRMLGQAAKRLNQTLHMGTLYGRVFSRQSSGHSFQQRVHTWKEDRLQSLQWLEEALMLAGEIASDSQPPADRATPTELGQLWYEVLYTLLAARESETGWQLQFLSDLKAPVSYSHAMSVNPSGWSFVSAPVEEDGRPVLHAVPKSWQAASSDGERARWALARAQALSDPETKALAMQLWADFLDWQFSVDTLRKVAHGRAELLKSVKLKPLSDDEALAMLTNGIQRFPLPEEQNPLRWYEQLADSQTTQAEPARTKLVQIYIDRQQHSRATELLKRWLANPQTKTDDLQELYDTLVEPAGSFRLLPPQPAGRPAKVDISFRNARKVSFVARQLDTDRMLQDIMQATAKFSQLRPIYQEFVSGFTTTHQFEYLEDFLSEPVATWSSNLPLADDHSLQKITLNSPLTKGGVYVIEASFDDKAVKTQCLLSINELTIACKAMNGGTWILVADAVTGVGVPNVSVEFVALDSQTPQRIQCSTDATGVVDLTADDVSRIKTGKWLTLVRDNGRVVSMLHQNVEPSVGWMGSEAVTRYFGVTERLVYRPGDKVRAKIWLGQVAPEDVRPLKNFSNGIWCRDSRGRSVWNGVANTDFNGAMEVEFELPEQSPLGVYTINLSDFQYEINHLQFRVDDFRKSEMDVSIETPKPSVRVGEPIQVKVHASYHFGAPVSEGTVYARVRRRAYVDPVEAKSPFDWCYGPGYEQQAGYFGQALNKFYAARGGQPEQIVFEQPLKLKADGTVTFRIDTVVAAGSFDRQSHEYEIEVEVSDPMLRKQAAIRSVIAYRDAQASAAGKTNDVDVRASRSDDQEKPVDWRFSGLQLSVDKPSYAVGETVQLQINSAWADADVWVFVRPFTIRESRPQLVKLVNHTASLAVRVENNDQPNFFVEALTVHDGQLVEAVREIFVPPSDKALNVQVQTDKKTYQPGEKVQVSIEVKNTQGRPMRGDGLIAVYDRPLEQLDTLPRDIRDGFWQRRRLYYPQTRHTCSKSVRPLLSDTMPFMRALGGLDPWYASDEMDMTSMMGGHIGGLGEMGGGGIGDSGPRVMNMPSPDDLRQRRASPDAVEVRPVRKNLIDSAAWLTNVTFDAQGKAQAEFTMPEDLTDWQVQVWTVGPKLEVGSGSTTVTSNKDLLIRLTAPDFLIERDQATLSAIVQNRSKSPQNVKVGLEVDDDRQLRIAAETQQAQTLTIAAGAEQRVQWTCTALAAGEALVRAKVASATQSDVAEIKLPIQINGLRSIEHWSGMIHENQSASKIVISMPAERRLEQSRLTLDISGSTGGAILEALPALVKHSASSGSEETLNRLLAAVLVRHMFQTMSVDLNQISRRGHPAFDWDKLDRLEASAMTQLASMQNSDDGWGWYHGASSAYATASVFRGLMAARIAKAKVDSTAIVLSMDWLRDYQNAQSSTKPQSGSVNQVDGQQDLDALIFYARALASQKDEQARLFENRDSLSSYGKVLLALATHQLGDSHMTAELKKSLEKYLVVDLVNETASLQDNLGWHGYSSRIETTALYLKLLVSVDPQDETARRIVRYLLSNRTQGTAWDSTRETATVIEALHDYLVANGESTQAMTGEIWSRGKLLGTFKFAANQPFNAVHKIEIASDTLPAGDFDLEIRKSGPGPLYFSVGTNNCFSPAEFAPHGSNMRIERHYYQGDQLRRSAISTISTEDGSQPPSAAPGNVTRMPIKDLEQLAPGTLIDVELVVDCPRDYERLMIRDQLAAGMELIELTSGLMDSNQAQAYREVHPDHVAFFVERLPRGRHALRYQLRCQTPGQYTALPAVVTTLAAPMRIANSRDNDVLIRE